MLKLKKEDNKYPSNLGIDEIEDLIASGYDWSEINYDNLKEEPKEFDEPSRLVTLDKAEKILGERPDASKPKPPVSKKPRPDTVKKFLDAVASYKDRVKALGIWEKKYDRLVALAQSLKNIRDELDSVREDLEDWSIRNPGTFILRKTMSDYSLLNDPMKPLEEAIGDFNVPVEIMSMETNPKWMLKNIDFDEDTDVFPSILITLDKKQLRIISIFDDLNDVTDAIERYVKNIQPKDILSKTNVKLDQKSMLTLREWESKGITNSMLDSNEEDLKLYLITVCFVTEIQDLNKYPESSRVSSLVKEVLDEI